MSRRPPRSGPRAGAPRAQRGRTGAVGRRVRSTGPPSRPRPRATPACVRLPGAAPRVAPWSGSRSTGCAPRERPRRAIGREPPGVRPSAVRRRATPAGGSRAVGTQRVPLPARARAEPRRVRGRSPAGGEQRAFCCSGPVNRNMTQTAIRAGRSSPTGAIATATRLGPTSRTSTTGGHPASAFAASRHCWRMDFVSSGGGSRRWRDHWPRLLSIQAPSFLGAAFLSVSFLSPFFLSLFRSASFFSMAFLVSSGS